MVSASEILNIVEIVYYVPALFLAAFVTWRHGFGRQLGWIFLVILSLIRIIGNSTSIASIYDTSQSLIKTSVILSSVGLSPLLLAMMGLLKRVNEGKSNNSGLPPRIFNFLHLPVIGALILAVLGGSNSFDNNPSTRNTGQKETKIAIIIFLLVLIALTGVTALTFFKIRHVSKGEKRLVLAAAVSIPFLFVRLIYSIIATFDTTSTVFSITATSNTAVIVRAVMSVAEEFIVVAVYIAAGFAAPIIARSQVQPGYHQPGNSAGPHHARLQSQGNSPQGERYPLNSVESSNYANMSYPPAPQQQGVQGMFEPYRSK